MASSQSAQASTAPVRREFVRLSAEQLTENWNRSFQAVLEYATQAGHVPSSVDPDPQVRRSGVWILHQRQNFKNGRLSAGQVQQLESLPNWQWVALTRRPRPTPETVTLFDVYLQNERLLRQQDQLLRALYPRTE